MTAALRDMQWRKRRFVIAIIGTGLMFAMTLVLTGLANGFRVEADRTVDSLGLDSYLIKSGAAGPFVGSSPFAPTELASVAADPGVAAAVPMVYGSATIPDRGSSVNVNVLRGARTRTRDAAMSSRAASPTTPARSRCRARWVGRRPEPANGPANIADRRDRRSTPPLLARPVQRVPDDGRRRSSWLFYGAAADLVDRDPSALSPSHRTAIALSTAQGPSTDLVSPAERRPHLDLDDGGACCGWSPRRSSAR